jgi:hypothetical protein
MNLFDLTISDLKRATAIKEQIEALNKELGNILGVSAKPGPASKKTRRMSASAKRSIAAAQKARWAKVRSSTAGTLSARAAKKTMSRATKAKLSAKLKAYWAAKKAGKK